MAIGDLSVGNDLSVGQDSAITRNETVGGTLGVTGVTTATGGVVGNVTGALTGNVTGDITGDLTGNITGNATVGGTLGVTGAVALTAGLTINGASRVRVTKNNAQSISHATVTIVQYDDEVFDNLGEFAAYRFTAEETGYYLVTASLQIIGTSWTQYQSFEIRIYKDGTIQAYGSNEMNWSGENLNLISKVTDLIYLETTHYVDIRAYQSAGGPRNTGTNANMNYFAVHRLS